MAIARRVDGSVLHASSASSASVTLSTVPTDGDALLALVLALTTVDPIGAPTGWTLLDSQAGGANSKSWLYYRSASGETATPYVWSFASAVKNAAWIGAYSGVDVSSPPVWAKSNPASGSAVATPSVTVPNLGWAVTAACCRHSGIASASTWTTSDGSDSERLDVGSGTSGSDIAMALYDSARALSPGGLARTLTSTNVEGQIGAWAVALAADGAPVATVVPARWGIYR